MTLSTEATQATRASRTGNESAGGVSFNRESGSEPVGKIELVNLDVSEAGVPAAQFSGKQHFELGPQLYAHALEGGLYEFVGQAMGEGARVGEEAMVYRCLSTGGLFYRSVEDFEQSMGVPPGCPV